MVKTLAEFRALDRRVWSLTAARMASTWAFSMVLPLLTVYLATDRGVPLGIVGAIITVAGITGALTQSYAGALSDRLGRVPLMIASGLTRTTALLLLGVAIGAEAPVAFIAGLIVLNNVARAFFDPPAQALIADLAPAERRVSAFALQRVGINIGFTCGPAMGAVAGTLGVPYHVTFYWALPFSVQRFTKEASL